MAKVTTDILYNDNGGMAFNCRNFTKQQAIKEYELDFPDKLQDYEPWVSYFRYKTKQEILDEGDTEEIVLYTEGCQLFLECEPDDVGAFKCWMFGDWW